MIQSNQLNAEQSVQQAANQAEAVRDGAEDAVTLATAELNIWTQVTQSAAKRAGAHGAADAESTQIKNETISELSKAADTEHGISNMAQALDGLAPDERTPEQMAAIEDLIRDIETGAVETPTFVAAKYVPEAEVLSGKGAGIRIPHNVQAAYVPSKNMIVQNEHIAGVEKTMAVREELGEWIANTASERGIDVAPGDAGTRFEKALSGQDFDDMDFVADPTDTTKVLINGEVLDAKARFKSITPGSDQRIGIQGIWGTKFTADPTARVFDGKLYVYTSTDNPGLPGNDSGGFKMPGYKVFSTFTPQWPQSWQGGNNYILKQENVPWAKKNNTMWAPDVVRGPNGKFFMFFPEGNSKIGVAISNTPDGNFVPRAKPLPNVAGIDPSVIQHNGKWFMYSARDQKIWVQELTSDNSGYFTGATNAKVVPGLKPNYKEGPHVYQRNPGGPLYMLYARVDKGGYRLELARSFNGPMGPFVPAGVAVKDFREPHFANNSAPTNHGSIVAYKGKNYVFHHRHLNKPGQFKYRTAIFNEFYYDNNGNAITVDPFKSN